MYEAAALFNSGIVEGWLEVVLNIDPTPVRSTCHSLCGKYQQLSLFQSRYVWKWALSKGIILKTFLPNRISFCTQGCMWKMYYLNVRFFGTGQFCEYSAWGKLFIWNNIFIWLYTSALNQSKIIVLRMLWVNWIE